MANEKQIILTSNMVDYAIFNYFRTDSDNVSITQELSMDEDQLRIKFSMNIDNDEVTLSDDDIYAALNYYVSNFDYEVLEFYYLGGIQEGEYLFNPDIPYYDGISITVKQKGRQKSLYKN